MKILTSFLLLLLFLLPVCTDDALIREKALQLAREAIIVDTHIDAPFRLRNKYEDISLKTKGNFDYVKAIKGGLNVAFMSIYIPAERQGTGTAKVLADSLIDMVESFAKSWPDKFVLAASVNDVRKQFSKSKISLALGMENGAPIENDLQNVKYFYDRGIRYITLTHAKYNQLCDSSYDPERKWNGLSPFGREVVREMNRLGIMVDVSHVSDSTFYQVIALSKAPVIASHSSCRRFTPGWERNMSDDMIRALARNNGVIQINFGSSFVNDDYRKTFDPLWKYIEANNLKFGDPETQRYIKKYKSEHPVDFADVSEVVKHIDHVVQIAGIDHVGLGSDFDGVGDSLPHGLKDVSDYPNIIRELLKLGYSESHIKKVCSGNLLRVWEEVERVAANMPGS
jgi:membrane dipeptidase